MEWMRGLNLKPIKTRLPKCMGDVVGDDDKTIMEPLSPSSRLLHEPTFNLHIVAIMGFNSKINPHIFRQNLSQTLLKHPRFSSLMVVDKEDNGGGSKMKWVETEVDLSQHIILVPTPEVDTHDDDDKILYNNSKLVEDYVYELSKERMDMSRPLWDLHILNVKTRDAEALAVLRMHHALGDGASIISLLLACTRQTANPQLLPTIPTNKTKRNKPKPSFNNLLKLIWNTLVDVFMFIATLLFLKDSQTPITPSPASESKPKRIAYRMLSLDDFYFIKVATNSTINDVALGVTQAALSMYLNRRYGEAGEKDIGSIEGQNNLPKNLRLRSCLFFNLRAATGIQALADMMKKEKGGGNSKWGWGNRFGYAILPLKIGIRDDPLDYLREAKATADRKKYSYEALFTYFLSNFVIKFFGAKAAGMLTNKIFSNTSTCFSNVVGPREEIEFYGHPIAFVAPTCYGQPSSLMVHFQSYVNKMAVIISVDESVIPDPNRLLDDFEKSLHLIKDAATSSASNL